MITIIDQQIYYNGIAYSISLIEGNIVHLVNDDGGICVELTAEQLELIKNI